MRHHSVIEWERNLKRALDRIDGYLEQEYGDLYPLHPARAEDGETSNKAHDGLFSVLGDYTTGFGSKHGEGYIVEVRMVTLKDVPDDIRAKIENDVASRLPEELKKVFPDRHLEVKREGKVFKIVGDLGLGDL